MKKKYIIQVYDNANDNIIHTEVTDGILPEEIEQIVKDIHDMVGVEYKISYAEVKAN